MNPKRILVVDDNKVILETIAFKLTANGYEVITTPDGAGAISIVRKEKPDLVLLDVGLAADPGGVQWDGFLVMDWMRRSADTKDIPVIMISRTDPEKYQDRALAAGALAVFHKPIDNQRLIETLRQIFERRETELKR